MSSDIAVVILTHNETLHLARAVETVRPFAREIFVVDSFSDDGTAELARILGATVLQNRFDNQARQFAWALANAPITAGWILRLDADETIGADLAAHIASGLPELAKDVVGVTFDRRHIFMDRWIRHGGRFPVTLLRLWRTGHGRVEDRWMDEHVVVWGGRTVAFPGTFCDHNLKDLSFFTAKHNGYATREAVQVVIEKYGLLERDRELNAQSSARQAALKRFVKDRLYNRIPFWLSAPAYFVFRYVAQLGFLDGREGLIYHFLQGYWYRFLVGAKIMEFERRLAAIQGDGDRLACLAEISGLRLEK